MQVLTAAEMKEADRRTADEFGVPFAALMENAGREVARAVQRLFPGARRVVVLAGKGNNGGDGLVAARHLAAAGMYVTVLLLAARDTVEGDAAAALRSFTGELVEVTDAAALAQQKVRDIFNGAEVIVDAVFGTGFRPPLPPFLSAVKDAVKAAKQASVLSVDLPSGWDADSREAQADAFRSDAVITFTAPKLAHLFGEMTGGPIVVSDIGSPGAAVRSSSRLSFTGTSVAKFQTPRKRDNNKGNFGHVLVVGGSFGKSGAPTMSSLGAMRAGAGLTTCATVKSMLPSVARAAPELMTVPLPESSQGGVSRVNAAASRLDKLFGKISVLAIGPGLGSEPGTQAFIHAAVAHAQMPVVVDADALNAFAGKTELLDGAKRTLVLTPHPGEMGRLAGMTTAQVQADRENLARQFATKHRLILVLKGFRTLVAHPDGRVAVNTTGNPGQAKGGSGDLLTGIVAGMLAQAHAYGATHGEAVEAAVYLHGLIADFAVAHIGEHSLLCTDTLAYFAQGFRFRVQQDGWTWLQGFPPEAAG